MLSSLIESLDMNKFLFQESLNDELEFEIPFEKHQNVLENSRKTQFTTTTTNTITKKYMKI
jgi:hypothetical protein